MSLFDEIMSYADTVEPVQKAEGLEGYFQLICPGRGIVVYNKIGLMPLDDSVDPDDNYSILRIPEDCGMSQTRGKEFSVMLDDGTILTDKVVTGIGVILNIERTDIDKVIMFPKGCKALTTNVLDAIFINKHTTPVLIYEMDSGRLRHNNIEGMPEKDRIDLEIKYDRLTLDGVHYLCSYLDVNNNIEEYIRR